MDVCVDCDCCVEPVPPGVWECDCGSAFSLEVVGVYGGARFVRLILPDAPEARS